MRATFRFFKRCLLGLVVVTLLVVAVLVSLGRYYLPQVGDHRDLVLSWVNQQAPFSVAAADLSGEWRRLSPSLQADDLVLGSGDDALRLKRALVKLNIPRSLWAGKLVFSQLQVAGVDLALSESDQGVWALQADWLPTPKSKVQLLSLDSTYAGLKQMLLEDVHLRLTRSSGREIVVDQLNVDYRKRGNDWRVISAGLPDASASVIRLVVEGQSLPGRNDFFARAHTKVDGFDASPYLSSARYQGWVPELPRFDGELWLEFQDRGDNLFADVQVEGVVDLQDIRFNHDSGKQGIDVPALKTQFKFVLSESGTPSVWLRDLNVRLKDEDITFKHANLVPISDGLHASFDSIDVDPVLRLLRRFEILPEQAQEVLATLNPRGSLKDITLNIPAGGALDDIRLSTGLSDVTVSPWKGAPGIRNLSGHLFASTGSGLVEIDSENFALHFPKLFHLPITLHKASGPVEWIIGEQVVSVRSGALAFSGDIGTAQALLDLTIPLKKEYKLTPLMDLQIELLGTEARHREKFIPYKLDTNLQNWLQRAIVSAHINEAAFIYRGSLIADASKQRTVQLFIDAENAQIDYDPAWPSAESLSADVFIDDANVLVEASRGSLSQLDLSEAIVRFVPEQGSKGGRIKVDTALNGELDAALAFLSNSPIKKNLGSFLDDWQATGKLSGSVKAMIPIGLDIRETINFRSRLKGARLSNDKLRLEFADLNGPLRYTSKKGLYSEGLVGTLWGDSLSASIDSSAVETQEKGAAESWKTHVSVRGSGRGKSVIDWLDEPLEKFVSGEFDYAAELNISATDSSLAILSQLRGLTSTLPEPFAKKADEELPLSLNLFLNEDPLRLRIQLADQMQAALVLHKDAPMTGTLSFGEKEAPKYAKDSIRLRGSLPEFELGSFLDVITAYSDASLSETPADKLMSVYAQDLRLRSTKAFDTEFGNVTASIASHGRAWTFAFEGKKVAGRANYDASRSIPLDLSLDRLYLVGVGEPDKDSTDEAVPNDAPKSEDILADFYPADLPEMRFRLADLNVNGKPYGRWSFETKSIQHGTIFRNLEASSRGMDIAGHTDRPAYLRWKRVGDQQQSEFTGVLSCADLGTVLEAWDYAPAIRSKSCRFNSELSWFGSPLDPQLQLMEGKVNILLSTGQFLETNSTANALRIFSLFNFDTLLRRLQFRFDDVFNRGLSYDEITGDFSLVNGTLNIESPFEVKGPSSRLQMVGSLDLVNETVDTQMVATLPISSNLPWVAALAAGLPVAAGVYVAGKIFQKPMEKLSSASYGVTGSWDEPTIKLQRIFDDKTKEPVADSNAAQPIERASQPKIPIE